MTDQIDLTFNVIIKITLPNVSRPISLNITLAQTDPVTVANGNVKALQDCTLGELQQFADQIEAEILSVYESATLVDLSLNEDVQVSLEASSTDGKSQPPEDLWLEYAVVYLPESSPVTIEPKSEHPSLNEEDDEMEVEETPRPSSKPDVLDEDTEIEKPQEHLIKAEPEPSVTVSETEQVIEERKFTPDEVADEVSQDQLVETPVADVLKPRIRILGRRRPLNHSTWAAVDILVNESAFRDAQAHAISSPDREVAGVLIGPYPEKQPDGRYVVHVSDMIIAKHTRMQGASVTYTPESWRYVNDKLNWLYPDDTAVIVGWYHTHPGFGIFLSGMDLFIHHNFFTQLWHIAMVLDPVARRTGFFCWDRDLVKVDRYDFPWPEWASKSW